MQLDIINIKNKNKMFIDYRKVIWLDENAVLTVMNTVI